MSKEIEEIKLEEVRTIRKKNKGGEILILIFLTVLSFILFYFLIVSILKLIEEITFFNIFFSFLYFWFFVGCLLSIIDQRRKFRFRYL